MKQFCLGIIVAIGLTLPAFGQASLKEQLVGAWALVSCEGLPWCVNPNGIQIFDASGHYATILAPRGRPKFNTPGATNLAEVRSQATPEQYKAAAMGLFVNFGTWSVNEADKTITYHYDGALFPNVEGTDAKTNVSVTGDELTFITPIGRGVYRRIRN
jgi:hypothetical protein